MKTKDLRSEQIALLRFEKSLKEAAKEKASGKPLDKAPVLAGLAAVTAAGASVAEKMGDASALNYASEIERAALAANDGATWLMNLAEVVGKAHNAIEAMALNGAFVILQANGGTPKEDPPEGIASLLTSGWL